MTRGILVTPQLARIATAVVWTTLLASVACSSEVRTGPVAEDPAAAGASRAGPATAVVEPRLSAPDGFTVTYFARDLPGARFMALGPDGSVYLSQIWAGQVTRLYNADGDGVAEIATPVLTGLAMPHGLAVRRGFLYVANTDGVIRVQLGADGSAVGTPERLNSYSGHTGHVTRTIVFGRDGAMYVSIGSSCNVCVEEQPDRATVMRYDEDGKNGRIYASGLRNAVGLAVHPVTGEIWATQNERDMLLPDWQDLPPEEINILRDGGDYGWPYCYGQRIPNPEFNDAARCAQTIPPTLELPAHAAPLGITFLYGARRFPGHWRGDAIVAYHGSWNRDEPVAPRLVQIHTERFRPVRATDFVTGWQNPDGTRWGRPADVLVHRDGSLLVSDDHAGVVYRVARR